MTLYYLALVFSALIFSSQFLITRQYQRRNGTGFMSSVRLSLFAYATIALFFLVKGSIAFGRLNVGFSFFTLAMTLGVAVVSLSCAYMGIKVLSVGDMSVYSVFMMLGSMVLPSLAGIIFFGESFGLLKGLALLLMIAAVIISIGGKKKISAKAIAYYIGIFVMNGLIGVFFTVHQNNPALTAAAIVGADGGVTVNNDVFMTWYGLSTVILCLAIYAVYAIMRLVNKKKAVGGAEAATVDGEKTADGMTAEADGMAVEGEVVPEKSCEKATDSSETATKKVGGAALAISIGLAAIYGVCNGLGDYFIALGTQPGALGASVSFPVVNGGTILFSTLFGRIIYKEKITVNTVISLVLTFVSTIMFLFV